MDNKLDLILQKLETLESGQTQLSNQVNEIKSDLSELKNTTSRIETKQELIYEHTGRLSEYHSEVKTEILNVKDRIQFNTHKITETELEIFRLKKQ